MRVRDLGTLIVAVDADERAVTGTKGAAIFALLVINSNQRVSVDALIEAAWGDHVTAGAASTLESHIWRLRQLLEPRRSRFQTPTVLLSDNAGYRLIANSGTLDSLSFADSASQVRGLLMSGQPQPALTLADQALSLWRGQPFGNMATAEWAQPAVAQLEELRGQLQEHRTQALLNDRQYELALADLPALIAAMPFREPLRAQLMEALHRSGRTQAALDAYQEARDFFIDELGVEPHDQLRTLHQQILQNDPALTSPRQRPVPALAVPAARRRNPSAHLPAATSALVGREQELVELQTLVQTEPLVSVVGPGGCGKTRIAVEVGRRVAADFPDGTWFVDLGSVTDPDLVGDAVASTIGLSATPGATLLEEVRNYLTSRRVLLVLDNCEHVLSQAAGLVTVALAGAASSSCFLITSREPLSVDGEMVWTLAPLRLPDQDANETPEQAPAVDLFLRRLKEAAPGIEVTPAVLQMAAEICVGVDGLPLAIELAAAHARSYSLADILDQVRHDSSQLGRLGRGPGDHRATLQSSVEWSYQMLEPGEQYAHRRLSVLPGGFSVALAEAVVGAESGDPVGLVLARLTHRSLLSSNGVLQPARPTMFRQLSAVRSHALHALGQSGEQAQCLKARDDWTVDLLRSRPRLGTRAEREWHLRIDDDYPTIRATLSRHLIDHPAPVGAELASALISHWYYRDQMIEGGRWLQLAVAAAGDDAPTIRLMALIALAATLATQSQIEPARLLIFSTLR